LITTNPKAHGLPRGTGHLFSSCGRAGTTFSPASSAVSASASAGRACHACTSTAAHTCQVTMILVVSITALAKHTSQCDAAWKQRS